MLKTCMNIPRTLFKYEENKYLKNPNPKREYEENKYEKTPNLKREMRLVNHSQPLDD